MLTEKNRKELLKILEKKKAALESQILDCGNKEMVVNGDKDNYAKRGGICQKIVDVSTIRACKRGLLTTLERVVRRVDALNNFAFNGVCPQCGRNMLKKDLKINPLMSLCAKCQAEINKNK